MAQFAQIGSSVDLSLNFHDPGGDAEAWCSLIEQAVRGHGHAVGSIGVTNEANLSTIPFAPDGAYPHALEALVDGLLAAAQAKRDTGATAALGFTAAGDAEAHPGRDPFWGNVAQRGGAALRIRPGLRRADDVSGWVRSAAACDPELVERTSAMLTAYRAQLAEAGVPESVPIRVSECGWPTGPGRSEADQAEALSAIVDTVASVRGELNVTHWALFTLRDADSSSPDPFGHFGVLRDDYSPKAAYHALRALIVDQRSG